MYSTTDVVAAMKQVSALILILMVLSPLPAFAYCAEPSEPWCLNSKPDEYCRMQVKQYLTDVEEWAQCVVRDAAKKANEDAEDKAEKVIKKWNCRVEGNSYCY